MDINRVELIKQCNEYFIKKYKDYNNDTQIRSFCENYYKWINRCMEDETLLLLIDMIKKYVYVPRQLIYKQWDEIYRYIDSINSPIIYSWIKKKEKKLNSSYDYVRDFINKHKIDDKFFFHDINESKIESNSSIIFIDDIAGTGKTLVNYLKKHTFLSRYNITIYYFVYYCTRSAYTLIEEYCNNNNINIKIVGYGCLKYNFKNDNMKYLFNKYSEQYVNTYIFGFEESQLLVSFYNNTPNNTFGIFWKNKDVNKENIALFCRKYNDTEL